MNAYELDRISTALERLAMAVEQLARQRQPRTRAPERRGKRYVGY